LAGLPKPKHECQEWTICTNFSKIVGEIRQIRAIRVKNHLLKKLHGDGIHKCHENSAKVRRAQKYDF
jgi:hypothetical protein